MTQVRNVEGDMIDIDPAHVTKICGPLVYTHNDTQPNVEELTIIDPLYVGTLQAAVDAL